jgi:tetratricopeptide (TPR) repeat protein
MRNLRQPPKTGHSAGPTKWERWWPALIIFFAVIIVFSPAFFAGFILDDDVMLTNNELMRGPISTFWCTAKPIDYFPLTYSSLWLEWRLWGANPAGYHVTNVLLHAISCIIIWRIFVRLNFPAPWLAALLFAVHPVNVESVAWIAERKNVLAMLFYAITVWSFVRFAQSGERSFFIISAAAFVLSLLAKPAVVAWPIVALGILWLNRGAAWFKAQQSSATSTPSSLRTDFVLCCRWIAPLMIPVIILGPVTVWFQSHNVIGTDIKFHHADLLTRIVAGGTSIWFYLWKSLFPVGLTLAYPLWNVNPHSLIWWLPWIGVAVVIVGAWICRRRWGRTALISSVYFLLMLAPVLGVFNMASHRFCYVSDRWQYFALPVVTLLIAIGLHKWKKQYSLGVALALAFSFLSFQQSRLYHDSETLWTDALRKNPSSWLAYYCLGWIRHTEGNFGAALEMYQRSLKLQPEQAEAHTNMGDALLQTGKIDEAINHLQQAIKINPDYTMAYYNLGCALQQKGDSTGAIDAFRQAIDRRKEWADAHYNLAIALQQKADAAAAISEYRQAIRYKPQFVPAHNNLGALLCLTGRRDEAVAELRQALMIAPADYDALANLGETLVEQRKPQEALLYLQKALATNPNNPKCHAVLGNALMALKQTSEAREHFEFALKYNPRNELGLYGLAACLRRAGQTNEAIRLYDQLITVNPRHAEAHYQLALLLAAQRHDQSAREHLREAVRLKPDWFDPLNALARHLATSPSSKPIEAAEAVRFAQRAVQLTGGLNAVALDTLGMAWARSEVFANATETAQRAYELAKQSGRIELAEALQKRIDLYTNHRAYIER